MFPKNLDKFMCLNSILILIATREEPDESDGSSEAPLKQLGPGTELRPEGDTGAVR